MIQAILDIMENKKETFESEIGGKKFIITTGELASQANSSCTVQYGDTVVLATVCVSPVPRENADFFPLMVDFDEKLYAAGKIKGSRFIKREGRPTDEAILTGRLIDRAIRPLFPEAIKNDVQVVVTVLSFDQENDPDILGLNAASVALAKSNIPWNGPIAAVRVGQINGEWVLNPSYEARTKSSIDLVIAATENEIVMMEAGANEVEENVVSMAIEFGLKHLRKNLTLIKDVQNKLGQEKLTFNKILTDEEKDNQEKIKVKVKDIALKELELIFGTKEKKIYAQRIESIKIKIDESLKADNEVSKDDRVWGIKYFDLLIEEQARILTLNKGTRADGRKYNEIRTINCRAGILPRTHGSGLFTRGETQVLSVVTLGSPSDEQVLDTMEESGKKHYMHHYNFPGFSVGEIAPLRGPGRREVGHGALAERALLPVLPEKLQFPYTIRVVSEVLSSNGSSSMASVCGSTLALMDAGVPIKKPVAGISVGMFSNPENKEEYQIVTDIQGVEDHAGDMDFKVAGTRDGITAIQLDIKLDGISLKVVSEALEKAKVARLLILDKIKETIPEPRPELSQYAPRIYTLQINPEKIRNVIGPGGKMINEIIDATGVTIDIDDSGLVIVTAVKEEAASKALNWIKNLTREVVIGEIFEGKVTKIFDFGAMVEILPHTEGLIHVSEIAPFRVPAVKDVLKTGDIIKAKVISIDELGRVNLSSKQTDFDFSEMRQKVLMRGNTENNSENHQRHNRYQQRNPSRKNY